MRIAFSLAAWTQQCNAPVCKSGGRLHCLRSTEKYGSFDNGVRSVAQEARRLTHSDVVRARLTRERCAANARYLTDLRAR
jgi:hypothetical protein